MAVNHLLHQPQEYPASTNKSKNTSLWGFLKIYKQEPFYSNFFGANLVFPNPKVIFPRFGDTAGFAGNFVEECA